MKQAEYNEIDTLLRDLARRERPAEAVPDSVSKDLTAKGAHLDADELSSYAERALPPSARARCTAHLADCDDCRKIVAQLSVAAGPLKGEPRIEESSIAGLTWTQKLATLFSPRLIRYAMPAVAVVVLAVAFYGWRLQQTNKSADFVAQNERAQPVAASKALSEPAPAGSQPAEAYKKGSDTTRARDQDETKSQPTPATVAAAKPAKEESKSSDEKKPEVDTTDSTASVSSAKKDGRAADKAAEPAYAPEPPPPASAKAGSSAQVTEQQRDLAKNNSIEDQRQQNGIVQQRRGPARNDNNEVALQRGPAKREAQPSPKSKAVGKGDVDGADNEDDAEETRTVLGRRFRRVSNAWVDTAYKSSMSIRSVSRGTDDYRGLVADEPVIGSIGKQLSGEVIVVWKGHAYRIN